MMSHLLSCLKRVFGAVALSLSLMVVAGTLSTLGGIDPAMAEVKQRPPRQPPAMNQENYKLLQKAQEQLDAKQINDAFATINKLLERKGLSSYERAMAYNFLGFLYYEQDNMPRAIQQFEAVLKEPNIPYSLEDSIKYTLVQLYSSAEQMDRALALLNDWFQYQVNPPLTAYVLKGMIYYQMGVDSEKKGNKARAAEYYRQAITPIELAISKAEADPAVEVRENWYSLLSALYYSLGDIRKTKDILEILIVTWPRPQYWVQLASMYYELEQPAKQLAVMDVAYRLGYIERGQNLINVAQLYNTNGAPYLAAKVMEQGFKTDITDDKGKKIKQINPDDPKHLELYGQALLSAQEYKDAIEPLRKAAAASNKGNIYLQLGHIYSVLEDWKGAAEVMRLAIQKGVDRPDQAYLYMGQAYFNLEDFKRAANAFQQAAKDPKSSRSAGSWMSYIDVEQRRIKFLADVGLRR